MTSRELRERMKHDPLVDSLNSIKEFYHRWKNLAWGVVIGALVVWLGAMWMVRGQRQKVDDAFGLVTKADEKYTSEVLSKQGEERANATQGVLSTLETVTSSYRGTRALPLARLKKAKILMETGQYTEARDEFAALISEEKNNTYGMLGRIGHAAATSSIDPPEGGIEAGIGEFRQILESHPDTEFVDQIRFQVARLLEIAGRPDEALEYYEAIPEDSDWAQTAKERIDYLSGPSASPDEPGA
jgi:predicted negative regulator of RcsB-dependent stress response